MKLRPILSLSTLSITVLMGLFPQIASAQRCVNLPKATVVQATNLALQQLNPRIHLNQVDPLKMGRKSRDIYLPGGNYLMIAGQNLNLGDFPYKKRRRRSHFLMDFNSRQWQVSAHPKGIRLRVEFETNGREIKGWCHKCKIKGRRDRAAADANIIGRSGRFPAVEAVFGLTYRNGAANMTLYEVVSDFNIDGRGFLELFDGIISKKVRSAVRTSIRQAWPTISAQIENELNQQLQRRLGSGRASVQITEINTSGNSIRACVR